MHLTDVYTYVQGMALSQANREAAGFSYTRVLENLRTVFHHHDLANIEVSKWARGYQVGNLVQTVLTLPEWTINGYGHQEIIPRNHFLIEVFRTPETEKPTLFHIIKLGFYAGLTRSNLKVRDFPDGVVKLFHDFKIHELSKFVDKADMEGLTLPDTLLLDINKAF
jgi:hypothetical protein